MTELLGHLTTIPYNIVPSPFPSRFSTEVQPPSITTRRQLSDDTGDQNRTRAPPSEGNVKSCAPHCLPVDESQAHDLSYGHTRVPPIDHTYYLCTTSARLLFMPVCL